jgi:type II secretory pathway pseudopilin PulG
MGRPSPLGKRTALLKDERGFSLIEVAVASVITMVSLVFLASLFTLAMSQNKMVKQFTATTSLAQQKLEELMAIEKNDARLLIPGGQTSVGALTEATKVTNYYDSLCVDSSGTPTADCTGQVPSYRRYWKIENDPGGLDRAIVIAVRVVALQASRGNLNEETTLTTVRSF